VLSIWSRRRSTATRDAGSGPLELVARDVLALSKLDWNNDAPFDNVPARLRQVGDRARYCTGPHLPDNNYEYRLFMQERFARAGWLRASIE
jgi:hypothetical protein